VKYNLLFSKGKIGRIALKNRAVMTPMISGIAELSGEASDQLIRYYEERAKGGTGLIIIEACAVDDKYGLAVNNQLILAGTKYIKKLDKLTEAIHRHNAKVFLQLYHGGNMSDPAITGHQNVSASNVASYPGREPRPLEVGEIKELVQKFVKAAVLAKNADFDGVEVHAAHGYLLAQFLSRYYNKRTDEYGGSFENRIRFLDEVVRGIRAAVGPDFALTVRFSGDEMTQQLSAEHMTLEDGVNIAKYLEATGVVDALNVSNGNAFNPNANCDPYSYQPGWKKHIAKTIKDAVSLPIIATNTIKTPDFAEQTLQEGICDFVGLGRQHLADPEFMNKAKQGREKEIRSCIGCMYCRETMGQGWTIRCAINPRLSSELVYSDLMRNGGGRPVVVVVAGPGGMEAAQVLARRGFKVTLLEKENKVGGTLNLADKPPFKGNITGLMETMKTEIEKAGVEVNLNIVATPEVVRKINPIGVFLACGAESIVPSMPGVDLPHVYTAEKVIKGNINLQGLVAVIGTGMTGLETAEILADKGSKIIMVEMLPSVGPGLFPVILRDIIGRINKHNPVIYANHKLTAIGQDSIMLANMENSAEVRVATDHVVLSLGVAPRSGLVEAFEKLNNNVIPIGDASKAGRLYHALKDGFTKAWAFEA